MEQSQNCFRRFTQCISGLGRCVSHEHSKGSESKGSEAKAANAKSQERPWQNAKLAETFTDRDQGRRKEQRLRSCHQSQYCQGENYEEDFEEEVFVEELSRYGACIDVAFTNYVVSFSNTIIRLLFLSTPELEAFLIANREEYLRHSALNYTVQQKQYNNSLTERLLELAAEHGYIFDEKEFSFVTVRDRIRCYFKSYVQSAKKRGIIIGYAARKAGLLSDADLERSAEQKGQIFTPQLP